MQTLPDGVKAFSFAHEQTLVVVLYKPGAGLDLYAMDSGWRWRRLVRWKASDVFGWDYLPMLVHNFVAGGVPRPVAERATEGFRNQDESSIPESAVFTFEDHEKKVAWWR